MTQSNPLDLLTHVEIWLNYRFRSFCDTRLSQDTHEVLVHVWYVCAPSGKIGFRARIFSLSLDDLWRKTSRSCTIILEIKSRGWNITVCFCFVHVLSLKTVLTCFKFFKFSILFCCYFMLFIVALLDIFKQIQENVYSEREIHVVDYDQFEALQDAMFYCCCCVVVFFYNEVVKSCIWSLTQKRVDHKKHENVLSNFRFNSSVTLDMQKF